MKIKERESVKIATRLRKILSKTLKAKGLVIGFYVDSAVEEKLKKDGFLK